MRVGMLNLISFFIPHYKIFVLKVVGNEKRRWVGKVANDRNMLGTMVIDVLSSYNLAVIFK
jgi:hypothetical protein